MLLKSIELYKCLGILNGIEQEKIFIDFSVFKSGLVLIQGKSGTGKSTFLNNCQPFRNGFKESFESDGYRYLDFEYKGHLYTSQVYQTKAMLFKDGKLLNLTQRVKEYDEVLTEELGSSDAFFKLLFAGRRFRNVLDLTKGERKDLIADYLLEDTKKYDFYQSILKTEYNEKIETVREFEIRLERKEELEKECKDLSDSISLLEMNLGISKEALVEIELDQNNFLKQEEENKDIKDTIVQKEKEHGIVLSEIESIKQQIEKIKDRQEEGANEFEYVEHELSKFEVEDIDGLDGVELLKKRDELKKITSDDTLEKQNQKNACESALMKFLSKQDEFFKLKEETLPCSSEFQIKCPLTKKRDVSKLLEDMESDLAELQLAHEKLVTAYNEYIVREFKEELEDIDKKLEQIRNYNKGIKFREQRENLIKEAGRLKEELEGLKTQLTEKGGREEHLRDNLSLLEGRLLSEYQNQAERLSEIKIDIGRIETKIEEHKRRIGEIEGELNKFKSYEKNIKELKKEAEEYPLLIEFFGNNGAKVFDLQTAGNQISEVSNNLLANYLNKNVKIKFETLGTDSKGGLKEVFDIQNSMDGGEWKTYASDGESVIISNAVREAMCYLRQNHDMKTVFIDELDGSIDSMSRVGFIKLLEEGAGMNQRYHTFLISHSEEVKSYVEQKIIFEEGEIKVNG